MAVVCAERFEVDRDVKPILEEMEWYAWRRSLMARWSSTSAVVERVDEWFQGTSTNDRLEIHIDPYCDRLLRIAVRCSRHRTNNLQMSPEHCLLRLHRDWSLQMWIHWRCCNKTIGEQSGDWKEKIVEISNSELKKHRIPFRGRRNGSRTDARWVQPLATRKMTLSRRLQRKRDTVCCLSLSPSAHQLIDRSRLLRIKLSDWHSLERMCCDRKDICSFALLRSRLVLAPNISASEYPTAQPWFGFSSLKILSSVGTRRDRELLPNKTLTNEKEDWRQMNERERTTRLELSDSGESAKSTIGWERKAWNEENLVAFEWLLERTFIHWRNYWTEILPFDILFGEIIRSLTIPSIQTLWLRKSGKSKTSTTVGKLSSVQS